MYSAWVEDFDEWRSRAREFLNAGVSPDSVQWLSEQQGGLFSEEGELSKTLEAGSAPRVSKRFVSQLKQAACYDGGLPANAKWALLYSLLWRLTKVDRETLLLKSDDEVRQFEHMRKSVSRDMHKMKAFVRFKANSAGSDQDNFSFNKVMAASDVPIEGSSLGSESVNDVHYSAWFEPEHAITKAITSFFVNRFTSMNWSILTPKGCIHWNQKSVLHTAGISRPIIEEDDFDHFWRVYYRSIFNPARLKEKAMMSEMPKKYWKYLPEAECIAELTSGAAARVADMAAAKETDQDRVREKSTQVALQQDALRKVNQI